MKVKLNVAVNDAFQFHREKFEQLPPWARSYSVRHGADRAKLYRHGTQCKVYVPIRGGFMPVNPTEWMIFDGEQILVVPDAEFKRRYQVVADDADEPT